mmetsp:Transcript_61192/g.158960  ORF Transcript_61192/g.158960 Transcript_61192/m.158960 type:complete len:199 (+) Transcript_61192:125-721(+)
MLFGFGTTFLVFGLAALERFRGCLGDHLAAAAEGSANPVFFGPGLLGEDDACPASAAHEDDCSLSLRQLRTELQAAALQNHVEKVAVGEDVQAKGAGDEVTDGGGLDEEDAGALAGAEVDLDAGAANVSTCDNPPKAAVGCTRGHCWKACADGGKWCWTTSGSSWRKCSGTGGWEECPPYAPCATKEFSVFNGGCGCR